VPWGSFPHIPGVETGCGDRPDDCWQIPGDPAWRTIARSLTATLREQGYSIQDVTERYLSSSTGQLIYAVSKEGEPAYYLNVVSNLEGTRYLTTEEPLTDAEFQQLRGS